MINRLRKLALAASLCSLGAAVTTAVAAPAAFDAELLAIQTDWATANYQVADEKEKRAAFEALLERASAFSAANPDRAEPLVWEGIVLSTYAGVKGGLGALGVAKDSRRKLEASLAIDPEALAGSAYTSLGTLYHKVPGFPVGFGSDKKARELLQKALSLNPRGIDPNYFYGEFLYDEGDYSEAEQRLETALLAAPRPGRESADVGRRAEIEALLAKVQAKLD